MPNVRRQETKDTALLGRWTEATGRRWCSRRRTSTGIEPMTCDDDDDDDDDAL